MRPPSRSRTSTPRWSGRRRSPGRAARQFRDGRAAPLGHAVHLGRVRAGVLHGRGGAGVFVPLPLAGRFAMIASYLLSSTFVPVLSVWILRRGRGADSDDHVGVLSRTYAGFAASAVHLRHLLIPGYLAGCALVVFALSRTVGTDIFPRTDRGQFQLRLRRRPARALSAPRNSRRGDRTRQGDVRPRHRRDDGRLRRHVPDQLPRPGHLPVDERAGRGLRQGRVQARHRAAGRGREGPPPRLAAGPPAAPG